MQKTIILINSYYNYFNTGDMKAFLELLHDDVVHDINQGEREVGKTKFISFMDRMNRSYKEQINNIEIMVNHNGQRAAAEFVVDGEYVSTDTGLLAASGQTYSLPCGAFFEIKDGKIARVTNYYNLNNWLKQVEK